MEVLLGGLASIVYGVADFIGGEASRKVNAATVVAWSGAFSLPLLLVVAVAVGGEATTADYALGFTAGALGSIGLVMLFAGLAQGRAAAVAPVSAALGAIVPVVVAVTAGDRPSPWAWVGVALAIPAIALSAWSDDDTGSTRLGLRYGVAAGLGFGGFSSLIGLTSDGSGLLPLVAARGALVLVVLAVGALGVWKLSGFATTPRRMVLSNSVLDVTANITLILALRAGSFALAAVAASFYPAVTVVLAKVVNAEHLLKRQMAGIALTLLALALIAAN
ncbi:MAG: DMT family transporter [Actinobacteria bacterium]|nr:MAG: DMT family transporter [Actinomycetota bacterium]